MMQGIFYFDNKTVVFEIRLKQQQKCARYKRLAYYISRTTCNVIWMVITYQQQAMKTMCVYISKTIIKPTSTVQHQIYISKRLLS